MHVLSPPLVFGGAGGSKGKFYKWPDGEEAGKTLDVELCIMIACYLLQHLVGLVMDYLAFAIAQGVSQELGFIGCTVIQLQGERICQLVQDGAGGLS